MSRACHLSRQRHGQRRLWSCIATKKVRWSSHVASQPLLVQRFRWIESNTCSSYGTVGKAHVVWCVLQLHDMANSCRIQAHTHVVTMVHARLHRVAFTILWASKYGFYVLLQWMWMWGSIVWGLRRSCVVLSLRNGARRNSFSRVHKVLCGCLSPMARGST